MRKFHHPPVGVPVKQNVGAVDGYAHDNLYLLRMCFVEAKDGELVDRSQNYLFTLNEIIESAERYYREMDVVIDRQIETVVGYAYPITYENRNGVMTTRFFCRFKGDQVESLQGIIYCGLFSPRELRRSAERYNQYIEKQFHPFKYVISNIRKLFIRNRERE